MSSRSRYLLFESDERTFLCWWNTSSIAMREGWKEHKTCQQEDAGIASVLSLAGKHPRTAERHRALGHTVRNGDFLDRRKLVTKAAVSDRTEKPNGAPSKTRGAREGHD